MFRIDLVILRPILTFVLPETCMIIEYDEENLEQGREITGIVRYITNAVFKFVR